MLWAWHGSSKDSARGSNEQQLQACSGLSNADYTVLTVLSSTDDGQLRALRLAAMTGWQKSRLHHQLTRTSKHGLVERPSGEARVVYVTLTQKGREALAEAAPRHSDHVRQLFIDCLTPEQLDQLADISAILLDNLQRPENAEKRLHRPGVNAIGGRLSFGGALPAALLAGYPCGHRDAAAKPVRAAKPESGRRPR